MNRTENLKEKDGEYMRDLLALMYESLKCTGKEPGWPGSREAFQYGGSGGGVDLQRVLGASGGWRNGSDASLPTPGTFQLLDSPQTPLLTLEALVTQQHISRWSRHDVIGSSGMVGTSSSFDNNNNGEGRSLRNRVGVHMRSMSSQGGYNTLNPLQRHYLRGQMGFH